MSTNRSKKLAIDTLLFSISNFGSKILVFLLTPLYTAVLTTEEYGIADLITTTIGVVYPILTLAIADATLRYALDKNVSTVSVMVNSMIFTVAAVPILIIGFPIIRIISSNISNYWWIFVAIYALFNIQNTWANFIKGIGKTKLFAVQGIIQTIVIIGCNVFFLLIAKIGLQGYLLSVAIGYAVPSVLMFFKGELYKYFDLKEYDSQIMKEMLKYSIPMIPTILVWAINTSLDKYMIIGIIGLGASGIYSVAHKIPTIITTILNVFIQAWQISAISNYGVEDESEYYTKVYGALNLISLLGCMVIIPLSKWISSFLFAKEYYSAWQYIPMLTISAFFSVLSGFLAAAFRAYKKTNELFTSVAISSIINIVLNYVLIKIFGVTGAAIATAISFAVVWLARMITVQSIVKVKINVLSTIISYILFIGSSLIITFDVSNATLIFVFSNIIVLLLNYKDIISITKNLLLIVGKVIKRKM